MTAVDAPVDATYSRKSTGLVRDVSQAQQIIFNATSTSPLGTGLVFGLFALTLFPRSNPYVALVAALALGALVWTTFALMSAAMPRVGGDYTLNSRVLVPWIGFAGNLCIVISSVVAAGLWSWWFATQGLSPAFLVIGSVADSHWFTDLGTSLNGGDKWLAFAIAVAVLIVMSALSILGTRLVLKVVVWLFAIAAVGFLVDMAILLFTSNESFRHTVDATAGAGAYDKAVAAARDGGLSTASGYSTTQTVGAIYTMFSVTLFVWWGTYTSAEFRGGGQRARQLRAMVGSGLGQGLILLLAMVIFLKTVGHDFFAGALSGAFSAGGGTVGTAGYAYFSALVANSDVLVAILSLAFVGWWLPGLFCNIAMAQRSMFAWAFDGLLPQRLARVNERWHTAAPAILVILALSIPAAAWVSFSSQFFSIFAVMQLFAYIPIIVTGISAIALPRRHPELYRGSPADWRIAGVPVLPVVGIATTAIGLFAVGLVMRFHGNLSLNGGYYTAAIISPIVVFAVCALWWYGARAARRGEGIDIGLAYQSIPPE